MTTPTAPTITTTAVTTSAFSVHIELVTPIDAPAERAWTVLAETDGYPDWNPFIRRLDGALVEGNKIDVELHLEGQKPRTISPRIVEVVPGRAFEWLGRIGCRGVLDGRHRFEIRPVDSQHCELVHSEKLSGVLVPVFRKMLTGPTPRSFAALNEALKVCVEDAD